MSNGNVPTHAFGQPLARVDGRLKVTGQARYAAEFPFPGLAHGVLLQSTVARGRVRSLDLAAAQAAPGVLGILTRENLSPPLLPPPPDTLGNGKPGESRLPLADDEVHWDGQPLGVLVAATLEQALHAATLVRVRYETPEPPVLDLLGDAARAGTTEPPVWNAREKLQVRHGDPDATLAAAGEELRVAPVYTTPIETHHPIEMAATTAVWEAPDRLLVHDATRGIKNLQKILASSFGLPTESVRVLCPFLGGHFGSKGFIWSHTLLTAAAARLVGRPVRLMLSRKQMSNTAGARARTVQEFALAASPEGQLTALRHATRTHTSPVSDYTEPCGLPTAHLYACPNITTSHRLARLNLPTAVPMRAPGKAPGVFGLECAMDELAVRLGVDPLELRLRNYAERDEHEHRPWSAKYLRECYAQGAERFGWSRRDPRPGATRDARGRLVGWGMATAIYPAAQSPAAAVATLLADGRVVVRSATHEAGTGTYTGMTQLAADVLGVPVERVTFELGDSDFPLAPVNGGSRLTSSVGPAVLAACRELVKKLIALAQAPASTSPLRRLYPEGIAPAGNGILAKGNVRDSYVDLLRRAGLSQLAAEASTKAAEPVKSLETLGQIEPGQGGKDNQAAEEFSFQSFGAQFVEVTVDPDLGEVRLGRFVGVYDVGRILNPRLARSQVIGAALFGVGMALLEGSVFDGRSGQVVNGNLADYHVATFADAAAEFDVSFIGQPDPHMPEPFVRGVGELGICGTPAAIANAVYHATGRRVRELPITPDRLLG